MTKAQSTPVADTTVNVDKLFQELRDSGARGAPASKRRKLRVAAIRAVGRDNELRQLNEIRAKLTRASDNNELVSLWGTEAQILLRALDGSGKKRVGAPSSMVTFHVWIAVHFLWLRKRGKQAKAAYSLVGADWGVSKNTIAKAVGLLDTDSNQCGFAKTYLDMSDKSESSFLLNLYTMMGAYLELGTEKSGMDKPNKNT